MRTFNRLTAIVICVIAIAFLTTNLYVATRYSDEDRMYMVEIDRLCEKIASDGEAVIDYKQLSYVKKVICCDREEELYVSSKYDYCIRQINGRLYRVEYTRGGLDFGRLLLTINFFLLIISALICILLWYVKKKIIVPFNRIESLPYELSKGNLNPTIEAERSQYFGKFVWGLNMLSDNVRMRREKELELHRDKKVLLLSLTHDIKTPLSVIKLNAQAIEKGLYTGDKQIEAARDISHKVDEIEQYVSQITDASREDFLDLTTIEEEFYLDDVIDKICKHYTGKLEVNKTEFRVEEHNNCLLSGDRERLTEVLQNLMENAIKYGDGKRICLHFGREENCCLITVENSGPSLDREEIGKIFDSFYRGSNVNSQPGSGLGLYICRQLMSRMNGDIFAKETESVFTVTAIVRMFN